MLLNIEHIDAYRIAAIDSEGGKVSYGDIIRLAEQIVASVSERALCFMLVENNVKSLAWVMASLLSRRLVPLILNAKTDEALYNDLLRTYRPAYIWQAGVLRRTDNPIAPLYPELSHLLPTSGSTGSCTQQPRELHTLQKYAHHKRHHRQTGCRNSCTKQRSCHKPREPFLK